MKESLFVHVDLGNGETVLAGQYINSSTEFTLRGVQYQRGGVFMYSSRYVNDSRAFSLDPVNLPLHGDAVFYNPGSRSHSGIFGVLLDAGPDAWGRHILQTLRDPQPTTENEILLAGTGDGVGAVVFSRTADKCVAHRPTLPFSSLADLHAAADLFMRKQEVSPGQKALLEAAVSLGGARPKTQIHEDGSIWIAKFDRHDDPFSYAMTEFVTMQIARDAGIHAADVALAQTAVGAVCLVRRFDRTGDTQHHIMSARALFNAFDVADYSKKRLSYVGMARLFNRVCDTGAETQTEIFRRMVMNVAIGNTDDHLGNHAIMRRSDTGRVSITPAYDVVPNHRLKGSQCLGLSDTAGGGGATVPSDINIANAAMQMGIPQNEAKQITRQVLDAAASMPERLAATGMTREEIFLVTACGNTPALERFAGAAIKLPVSSTRISAVESGPLDGVVSGSPGPTR